MNVVYLVGGRSIADRVELKYSIRSVEANYPNAGIWIVGDLPKWHTGENHIKYYDGSDIPYINTYCKMREACRTKAISDTFIYIDDDMFLLEPYTPTRYYDGTMTQKREQLEPKRGQWIDAVKYTHELEQNALNYCTHTPLPINKQEFLRVVKPDEMLQRPGAVQRQIYCARTEYHNTQELNDIKVIGKIKGGLRAFVRGKNIVSTSDAIPTDEIARVFGAMFPHKSKYEK